MFFAKVNVEDLVLVKIAGGIAPPFLD